MSTDILSLAIFLTIVYLASAFLNTFRLVYVRKIKKKCSSDFIRAHIYIINIAFTLTAIPYYLIKEAKLLENYEIICKILFVVTDFIMFIYNNLLILMAFDRFCFICTNKRFDISKLFKFFYAITLVIASSSFVRLFANNCRNHLKNFDLYLLKSKPSILNECKNIRSNNTTNWIFWENTIIVYNYFILFVVSFNWVLTAVLYSLIIKYVYRKRIRFPGMNKATSVPNISALNKKCQNNANESSNETHETSLIKEGLNPKIITVKRKKINTFSTNSKHWSVTKTFIKVKFYF